jgi:predicted nucleic acid-binding protein
MNFYFYDSSALVKRYVNETGSSYVSALIDSDESVNYLARITQVEVYAAINRRNGNMNFSPRDISRMLSIFQRELDVLFQSIVITRELIRKASELTGT